MGNAMKFLEENFKDGKKVVKKKRPAYGIIKDLQKELAKDRLKALSENPKRFYATKKKIGRA